MVDGWMDEYIRTDDERVFAHDGNTAVTSIDPF